MSDRLTTGAGPWLAASEIDTDSKTAGSTSVEVWEGSYTECRTKQLQLIAAGATRVKLAAKGDGNWQARGSFPFDPLGENPGFVDTMELEVNALQTPWDSSPVYHSKFSDVDGITGFSAKAAATIPIIRDVAAKYRSGQPTYNKDTGKYMWKGLGYDSKEEALNAEYVTRMTRVVTTFGLTAGEIATALKLHNEVAFIGLRSFTEYTHVFRRRVTAGSPRAIRANQTGGNQIWTTAEVIAWEGIRNDGWFDLPPDVMWHKDKPRVLAAYGQKTEISYSYTELSQASGLVYRAYGNARLLDA